MTARRSNEVIDADEFDEVDTEITKPTVARRRAPAKKTASKRAQPHKPAGVKEPTDRPKSAAQRETEASDTIDVEWGGMTFTVLSDPDDWDFWTVTQPLAANNIPLSLAGLLGPEQMMRLRLSRPDIRNPEVRDLFNVINKAIADINTGN